MDKTTSRDGTTIAFDRTGAGPPVVIVEGAFCTRMTSGPLAALLAPGFTVYAYDRRGRGDSGDTPPYAVARELEDLAAVIDAAGGSAAVYGMSSGAVLALEAAAHGLPLTRLAIYEPPVATDDQPGSELIERISALVAAGDRGGAVAEFLARSVGVPDEVLAGMRAAPMWAGLESVAHTLPYDLAITRDRTLLTERASSVAVPTLVLAGADTSPYLKQCATTVADLVPGATHRLLDGQTHAVDPAALAPLLADFFG